MVQLPSKSTHILQPLDVGCFTLLQRVYEEHLRQWLTENPFEPIRKVDFLNLLFDTRSEVYTVEIIESAWRTSGCYPVDVDRARGAASSSESAESAEVHALATPLLIRKLGREAGQKMVSDLIDNGEKRELFHSIIDTATVKLIEYRDIAP